MAGYPKEFFVRSTHMSCLSKSLTLHSTRILIFLMLCFNLYFLSFLPRSLCFSHMLLKSFVMQLCISSELRTSGCRSPSQLVSMIAHESAKMKLLLSRLLRLEVVYICVYAP